MAVPVGGSTPPEARPYRVHSCWFVSPIRAVGTGGPVPGATCVAKATKFGASHGAYSCWPLNRTVSGANRLAKFRVVTEGRSYTQCTSECAGLVEGANVGPVIVITRPEPTPMGISTLCTL